MVLHRSAAGSFTLLWRIKALVGACTIVSLCTSSAVAHDWYTNLVDPVTGYSCCGAKTVVRCHDKMSDSGRTAIWSFSWTANGDMSTRRRF